METECASGRMLPLVAIVAAVVACGDEPADPAGPPGCGLQTDGSFDSTFAAVYAERHTAAVCNERTGEAYPEIAADCSAGWCDIPAGSFIAGRKHDAESASLELPEHAVTLTRPFVMQQAEVTVTQWLELMGGENPSRFGCGGDCPVTGVTYFDALAYADAMSAREDREPCYALAGCDRETVGRECESAIFVGPDCEGYRLPSEAEWELAAAAGTQACIDGTALAPEVRVDTNVSCSGWAEPPPPATYCGNAAVTYDGAWISRQARAPRVGVRRPSGGSHRIVSGSMT